MDERRNVDAAFEQLLAALGAALGATEAECLRALEDHDLANLDRTRRLISRVAGIQSGVMALRRGYAAADADLGSHVRRYLGRLEPGQITHRSAFREPILRVVLQAGGEVASEPALKAIELLLADKLSGADFLPVPSRPQVPRWRNACHSARHDMVREGLLAARAARGMWVLTPAGTAAAQALPAPDA